MKTVNIHGVKAKSTMGKTVGVAMVRTIVISLSTGSPIGYLYVVWDFRQLEKTRRLEFAAHERRCIRLRDGLMYSQAILSAPVHEFARYDIHIRCIHGSDSRFEFSD